MKVHRLHSWKITPRQAVAVQRRLRRKISLRGSVQRVELVAGADVSYKRGDAEGFAAVVVLTYPDMELVETATARMRVEFPYVPGLLTFREGPLLVEAFRKIRNVPHVTVFDGHGVAHPRQFGLACHMGLLLDLPSFGCAKTRLVGHAEEPGPSKGSYAPLRHGYFTLGRAVRTRTNVKPVFVSPGHKIDLPSATSLALCFATRYRIPEPTRLAHHVVTEARLRG